MEAEQLFLSADDGSFFHSSRLTHREAERRACPRPRRHAGRVDDGTVVSSESVPLHAAAAERVGLASTRPLTSHVLRCEIVDWGFGAATGGGLPPGGGVWWTGGGAATTGGSA